ncbi:hypothetical protein [uncultured Kordia sp.]|uniref:beta strand repeat-containing protein n=1 Tax=uncultured Kordia sp. TaxID=507699 RepID=UPI0026136F27|nr:hypothetical protein [uncultured Kordia sp.]
MKTFFPYSLLYLSCIFFSNVSIANDSETIQSKNPVKIDEQGNLIYTDTIGVDDDISIVIEGANYRLSNAAITLAAGNKIKQDGNAVLVPMHLITGKILINTENGDDTFTVNLSNGNIKIPIIYNGGNQNTSTGDDMILLGNENQNYDTVTHTFINAHDGFINVTGNSTIHYKGLEPITDNLNASDRVFTFTGNQGSVETITLEPGATSSTNRINSSLAEMVDFTNPTNSLTINLTGFGDDILEVRGLSISSNADLIVNSDGVDEIRFPNNSIDLGNGNLNLTSHNIHFSKDVTARSITTTSTNTTTIESAALRAVGGSVTMNAGTVVPAIDGINTDVGGLYMNAAQIQTSGTQDINIIATTYAARNIINQASLNGFNMEGSSIITEFGDVTITGSGVDNGLANFNGVRMGNSTNIQSLAGQITINGTGRNTGNTSNIGVSMISGNIRTNTAGNVDITGTGYLGIDIKGAIQAIGSGSILLQGTSNVATASAINISSTNASLSANNGIHLTANTGYINTPNGVATQSQFNTNNTIINGVLAPGQSLGQVIMNSNLVMDSSDVLEIGVDNFTNFGTEYDQLKVNGAVNLTNATFNLTDQSGDFPQEVVALTIIDNDGTDPIVGTFNGLPQGATINGNNGKNWSIFYNQGDGNDVVLSSGLANPNVFVDEGNMVFTGIAAENDDLTIVIDGANYRLNDASKPLIAGQGAIQDGNDVLVSIASVTGAININTGNGNDKLNIDLNGGLFTTAINFDGGNDTDGIAVTSNTTLDTITHTVDNSGAGTIAITGNNTISYTASTETVEDNLTIDDRIFTVNSNNDIVFEPTGSLGNQVTLNGLVTIAYTNPNSTLTINGSGTGQGFLAINGFAAGFTADLTINRSQDIVRFGFNTTNPIDLGAGNLTVVSKVVLVRTNISTAGLISLVSLDSLYVEGGNIIATGGQNISLIGGTQPTNGTTFTGLEIFQSTVQTTGAGTITLVGTASISNPFAVQSGMTLFEANFLTDTGDIGIMGFGAGIANHSNIGINIFNTTNIQSNSGNINIVGTAGSSLGNANKGIFMFDGTNIQTMGAGTITIEGTGGAGLNSNYGVEIQMNTTINAENGDISITGTAIDTDGIDQIGILMNGAINTSGTGNISLTGTGATANNPAIDIIAENAQIQSGGIITMTGNTGEINTSNGIASQAQLSGINTIINGELAPGQSPGQLIINGNLTMASDDTLEIEVNDFNNVGTDYDQVQVIGSVNLNNANFNFVDQSGDFPQDVIALTIIDNDGTDPIVGTFNGLSEGATITGNNGKNWNIFYNRGDGNDVVLRSEVAPNVFVDAGNMVFTGIAAENNDITIVIDGANYRLSDANNPVMAGQGAVQDGDDVLVSIASVAGAININTGNGNDQLNINMNGGLFTKDINFDGGDDTDGIAISSNATLDTITHTVNSNGAGTVAITGNNVITYTASTETIEDNITADERAFTLNSSNSIQFEPTGSLGNQVTVDGLVTIGYVNPNNTLVINGSGAGEGFVFINGFATGFTADLTINRLQDIVRFGFNTTNPIDLGTGDLIAVARVVLVRTDVSTAGSISLTSLNTLYVDQGDIISSGGQNITLNGGTQPINSNFAGIEIFNATIQTIGAGTITIAGTAFLDSPFTFTSGMTLFGTDILTDTGDINLIGIGATIGSNSNRGINMSIGTNIQSNSGNINIVGTAGNSIGDDNKGILMFDGTYIETMGTGTITIQGTGGEGVNSNYGVEIQMNTTISAENGDVAITGTATDTDGSDQIGIILDGTINTTGTGNISLTGTSPTANDPSIDIISSNAQIQSGGVITMTGNTGEINTPNGVALQAQLTGTNTIINGKLAPGQSPGHLIIDGNLTMTSDDTLEIEVSGFDNPGTEYDQVQVNGAVNLNGVALNLVDSSGSFSSPENLIIINNDADDPIVGTFNGLPNGSAIAGNAKTWYIYYNLAGTNDVLLSTTPPNIRIDGSGNLVFLDPYSLNDNLTIIVEGVNYRMSDAVKPIIAGPGVIQDNNDVLIPIDAVTGVIDINTQFGDDHLSINLNGGNFTDEIHYDGGTENNGLALSGANTYANMVHTLTGTHRGAIDIPGNSTITYEELTQTLTDNLETNDKNFHLDLDDYIVLRSGGTLANQMDVFESTTIDYKNPLNSLTISNIGSGDNTMVMQGFATGFDADLTINATEDDDVRFDTNATNITNGNININSGKLTVDSTGSIITTGSITTFTKSTTTIAGIIQSNGGNISMIAGTEALPGSNSGGIYMQNGRVEAIGSGTILMDGTIYVNAFTDTPINGFWMRDDSRVTTDTGNITVTGNGIDNGNADYRGINLGESSRIESNTGNISLQGTSSNANTQAIRLVSTNIQVQTGGDVNITANTGAINTSNGVPVMSTISAANTTFNGILSPGESSGQVKIDGNFIMGSDDTLKIQVGGFDTAGTDYDQVQVNGAVIISNTTLELDDETNFSPENANTLIIIDNDGTDPVNGTFNGLPNGASISSNGSIWYIYYDQGDGNDVILSSELLGAVTVRPSVFLQGAALNPNVGEEMLMRDDLRVAGIIPTTSPYADTATVDAAVFNTTGVDAIVDWVWVEVRSEANIDLVVAGKSALLQRDGDITDLDGTSPVAFNIASGNYYIVIRHRNHLGVMSNAAIALRSSVTFIDFTNPAASTFGSNAQTNFGIPSGANAMWAGNVNGDAIIQYSGTNPDTPAILSVILNDPGNFLNFPTYAVVGYNVNDVNMNGNAQYSGVAPDTPFILQNVLAHPGNFLNFSTYQIQEQLPSSLN